MPEKNFQSSSFIPKDVAHYQKPRYSGGIGTGGSRFGSSIFSKIGMGVVSLAGLLVIATFFYTQYLESNLLDLKQQLASAQDAFEPEIINELDAIDTRLSSVTKIINNHTAITPVLDVVESITLSSIQIVNLSIKSKSRSIADERSQRNRAAAEESVGVPDGDVTITMSGLAPDFASTALQSEAISENQQIINPKISQFERNEFGAVAFTIQFTLPADFMLYKNTI